MVFQPDALKRLTADIDGKSTMGDTNLSDFKGCDMVTGLYFKRRAPHTPVIFSRLEQPGIGADGLPEKRIDDFVSYPKDSLFTVSGCGFGCCMTSVKLLKAVWDKFGPAFAPLTWAGEDIAFCYRAKQLGYDIWCDSRVKCGHIGSYIYTEDDFLKRGETK
jgi:hypothetical protein